MKIITLPIGQIKQYEHNAKNHPPHQIQQIARSIKEFGFNDPIAIDETNTIIEGHGRYLALLELGRQEVECIRLDHLTEAQKKAYIIAHNKLTLNSDFDLETLAQELEAIKALNMDPTITGFELEELDKILGVNDLDNITEDEFDGTLPEEPYTESGDVWILGRHRLMCGSSIEEAEVNTLMNGEQADMILTDPPYNVDYEGGSGLKIQNDKWASAGMFYDFLFSFFKEAATHTKPGAPIYVFHADTEGLNFRKAYQDAGFKLAETLVWVKNALVMGRQDYQWRHEPILYGWKPGAAHKWYGGRSQDTVIDEKTKHQISSMKKADLLALVKELLRDEEVPNTVLYEDKPTANDIHPTMKPVRLLARLIINSSTSKDLIYDGFGGSGSTIIAAEQTQRRANVMELDPKYCDAVVNRFYKFNHDKQLRHSIKLQRKGKEYDITETEVLAGDE